MFPAALLDAYVAYFETLQPETVDRLDELASPDVHFRDPFNDVRDRTHFKRALSRMFEDVDDPRFAVTDRAVGTQAAYLRWTFTFRPKGKKEIWRLEGVSEVRLDPVAGRISEHLDHWDAAGQFYEKLPGLGLLLRQVRRRLAA